MKKVLGRFGAEAGDHQMHFGTQAMGTAREAISEPFEGCCDTARKRYAGTGPRPQTRISNRN
jgi:hypothetical protein